MAIEPATSQEYAVAPEKPLVERLQGTTMLQVPTPIWLHDMSEKYRKQGLLGKNDLDFSLGDVPDVEWDEIARQYDSLYFLTIFKRSHMGREHALIYKHEYQGAAPDNYHDGDVVSSGFAHIGYDHLDPMVARGDWEEFDRVVTEKLHPRGLHVGVDFIPHITGMDHPLVGKDHEFFVTGTPHDFAARPSHYIKQVFYDDHGRPYYIAHGNDQYYDSIPWTDTAKINLANIRVQEMVTHDAIDLVTKHQVDFLRFDMAHLATRDNYPKTSPRPLLLEEHASLLRQDIWDVLPQEVKQAAAAMGKDVWFVAEAYDHEAYLREMGIDFIYDHQAFFQLEKLIARGQTPVESLANYIKFNPDMQNTVHYQSNHDEPRADDRIKANGEGGLGDAKRARAFAAISAFRSKGIWLIYDGQQRGVIIRPPAQLRRVRQEQPNEDTQGYFERLLLLRKDPVFREGHYVTPQHDSDRDDTFKNIIVQEGQLANRGAIACTNLSWEDSRGNIRLPIHAQNVRVLTLETGEMSKQTVLLKDVPHGQYCHASVELSPWESKILFYDVANPNLH